MINGQNSVRNSEPLLQLDRFPNVDINNDLTLFNPQLSSKLLAHDYLSETLEKAVDFYADESLLKGRYFARQFEEFDVAVSKVSGVIGTFGTGYPFYAEKPDGQSIHAIPEISRYIKSFYASVEDDRVRGYGSWICGACDAEVNLPDFKKFCKPCKAVSFKPRDIFKALPDLDYWVIVDDSHTTPEEVEDSIQTNIEAAGFFSSDADIVAATLRTRRAMDAILGGIMPDEKLPSDVHIVTKTQLLDCMAKVPDAVSSGQDVPISPRSLHKYWEPTDAPYDFVKDFVFSFTPNNWQDPLLVSTLIKAQKDTAKVIDDPVGLVGSRAPKEARQLEAPGLSEALTTRVSKWREENER